MNSPVSSPLLSIISEILFLTLLISSKSIASSPEKTAAAFFIFGDSNVDTGNKNYIQITSGNRASLPPYGQNAFSGEPTGRFSNGRLIVDFIAEYAELPTIPPFLQPSAPFRNGVNFAHGGAGVLPETHQEIAIDMRTQLNQFDKVINLLSAELGDTETKELIANAVYCISIGSNDYLSYLSSPAMQEAFTPEDFVGMVTGNLSETIWEMYERGARKFGVMSLCPLGCLPALRAANPKADGSCFEDMNALALAHNNALSAVLISFEHILKGFKYAFTSGFYIWLHEVIDNPSKFGFQDGINACCGSGPYGGLYSCGGNKEASDYDVCKTPEEFVWWDSFHGTEKTAKKIADMLWEDSLPSVGPYNLKGLFFSHENSRIADLVDTEGAWEAIPM